MGIVTVINNPNKHFILLRILLTWTHIRLQGKRTDSVAAAITDLWVVKGCHRRPYKWWSFQPDRKLLNSVGHGVLWKRLFFWYLKSVTRDFELPTTAMPGHASLKEAGMTVKEYKNISAFISNLANPDIFSNKRKVRGKYTVCHKEDELLSLNKQVKMVMRDLEW